ncbi:hypothetical protein VTK73DRAFT_4299 [Phialemonium thermophilum]|uniref:Deacetylase sirtuin-type domain-containing protein n=1 Tax=Phialemonium thermophilum TaxID=223376 RepID=A0ABR3V9L8_9PEZI
MKPDITFFGESLPDAFSERLTRHDRHRVDLVVVIGTSLRVAPVSEVVPFLPPNVPQLYISRTPVGHVNFDIDLLGDCDVVVAELCRRAGWDLRHEMIPEGQVVKVRTVEGYPSRHVFTQVEPPVEGEKPGKKSEGGGGGGGSGGGENGEGEKKKHRDSKDADDEEAEKKEG